MTMGAPRKAQQGIWHAEARRLRDDEGWTYTRLAAHFGVTTAAVYFALNPDKRVAYAMKKAAKETPRGPVVSK